MTMALANSGLDPYIHFKVYIPAQSIVGYIIQPLAVALQLL